MGNASATPGTGDATEAPNGRSEWFATLVETLEDPVYVLDETGAFVYVNRSFLDLTGYDRTAVIGEHPSLIKDEAAVETAEEQLGRLLSSDGPDSVTFEIAIRPREGDPVVCEDHMTVLPYDEEFRGSVGVLRDVTDRKRREAELERQRERLDRVVGVASHDLRNPLNVLTARLDLAERDGDAEHFAACRRAVDRIERLVDDMLVLARGGHVEDDPRPVALSDLAASCWDTVETSAASLDAETAPTVVCGESQTRHLLENLFRNAVQHGGDDVAVDVGPLADGFFVADDGPGIPAEERDRVFDDGYSTGGGTGLGLSIVSEIADAHDWSVAVTESEAGGARFEFTGVELARD